jgi:O-antigen ligase
MKQVSAITILAYLFFMPTIGLTRNLPWHDDQRLGQIILFMIVALVSVFALASSRRGLMSSGWASISLSARLMLVAAFVLGAVSSALAPLPRWAFLEWATMALLFALAMLVFSLRQQNPRFDRVLVGVLALTASAYLLKLFVAYTAVLVEHLQLRVEWLLDGFSTARFFGQFQAITLPLMVFPAMYWAKTPLMRVGLTVLPVMWWMLAVASGTRGTWLAMIVAGIIIFICMRRAGYPWLTWQIGTFLAGLAAYGFFFLLVPDFLGVPVDMGNRSPQIFHLRDRDVIWNLALDHLVAHPIFGVGPMHFAYYQNPVAAHPHMSILQWATEWGLPSAVLICGIALYAIACYTRQLRATTPHDNPAAYMLQLAVLASLCAAATQSLVDGIIVMPYSQTLLAVVCGWAFSIYRSNSPVPSAFVLRTEVAGHLAVLLSAAILLWGVYPEVFDISGRQESFVQRHPEMPGLRPRYWTQGWISE